MALSVWLHEFFQRESAGGIMLVVAAAFALVLENSPLAWLYDALLDTPVAVRVGALEIAKPLLLWINDGLMAVFFLLIGLEVKREVLEGELSNREQILLPAVGAVGGMAIPALIYLGLNWGDATALNGWAIPAATDIAFALGVLALLGDRVPNSLRVFLLALAIFDDLGAIVIIALFYSGDLSTGSLIAAAVFISLLVLLNRFKVTHIGLYMVVGVALWVAVLKSGVHATLAGVALAFAIPLRLPKEPDHSPLETVEHALLPWVAFGIAPVFAFANAGISLQGLELGALLEPVALGISAGLFVGKQIGVFLFCGLLIWMGLARLPEGASWAGLYGVSVLCGIGFTMSLFISSLAFEHSGAEGYVPADRLGILVGTLLSAVVGYLVLRWFNPSMGQAVQR